MEIVSSLTIVLNQYCHIIAARVFGSNVDLNLLTLEDTGFFLPAKLWLPITHSVRDFLTSVQNF